MKSEDEDSPKDAVMLNSTQTSTTKALLIFIHVPKILRVYIEKDKDRDDTKKVLDKKESDDESLILAKSTAKPSHRKTPSFSKPKPTAGHRRTDSLSKSKPSTAGGHHRKTDSMSKSKPAHRKTESFASTRNEIPILPLDDIATSTTTTAATASTISPTHHVTCQTAPAPTLDPTEKLPSIASPRSRTNTLDNADLDDVPGQHDIGYVEAEDKNIEHVVTAEEMAAIVHLELDDLGDVPGKGGGGVWDAPHVKEEDEEEETKKTEAPVPEPSSIKDAMKNFFGIVINKENEEETPIDREEAIRIVKAQISTPALVPMIEPETKGPPPNTEIKLEALLTLTCKNMFKEGCFFTAPVTIDITKGEGEWTQFTIMCKPQSIDTVLERLERIGVGSSVGMISVYKSELLKSADTPDETAAKMEEKKAALKSGAKGRMDDVKLEQVKQEWKNAASRMRVEQIKEQIHEQAGMTFDFVALLLVASILAGVGLIVNSTVVIVASMLVSPIMGPVMGITFGSRVLDWKLARESAAVEVGALLIAVLTGAVVGLAGAFSFYADDWPTPEMASRGDVSGLITGVAIAIPSGMGVALSILGNNTASLVGVAISASLLPPAVNAGICWAHAILIAAGADVANSGEDFFMIGIISFVLTLVNILCIWVFGIIMFTIKEVTPSEKKSAFWARDIKVARATQKHGPPKSEVDMDTIKAGLQEALEQKRREAGQAAGNAVKRLKRRRRRNQQRDFSFSLIDDVDEDDEEDLLDFFMMGLNPIVEETQGMDPKDRAAYLGFRASVEDFAVEEELPVAERPAWLSFLGGNK